MRKWVSIFAGAATVIAAAGCDDSPLEVENTNQPDIDRAYSTPAGIESVIGTTFQLTFQALHGSNTSVKPQLMNMAFESYASVANNGMALRAALPRQSIQNTRGHTTQNENFREFRQLQLAARTSTNAIGALDSLVARSGSLGTTARNARARAFAFFGNATALGFVALVYDSAAIITPMAIPFPSDITPPLSSAADVMAAAIALLDSAEAIATAAPTGTDGFPIPTGWIRGNPLTKDQFIRVVKSYRARFRANVARTPAERSAVDWAKVIADVEGGITQNFEVDLEPSEGWNNAWIGQHHIYQGWHQMAPFIIGMADTSRAYDAWLALPINSRAPFLIRTPDKRFPSGETRAAQITNSPATPAGTPLYFRNRATGLDTPGEPWGTSYYDHYRFIPLYNASSRGRWPVITKVEMDMLAAEGHIRAGRFAQAAALIDKSRIPAGLPSLVAANITSATQPVPGGNACVPRVPAAPSYTATVCGNIFEALKWEKRMETTLTGYAVWYFDSRGWGDLPEFTGLEYPVPYQELDARGRNLPLGGYNLGGQGLPSAAAKGTYGF